LNSSRAPTSPLPLFTAPNPHLQPLLPRVEREAPICSLAGSSCPRGGGSQRRRPLSWPCAAPLRRRRPLLPVHLCMSSNRPPRCRFEPARRRIERRPVVRPLPAPPRQPTAAAPSLCRAGRACGPLHASQTRETPKSSLAPAPEATARCSLPSGPPPAGRRLPLAPGPMRASPAGL
jgi:hypothetical protein